MRRVDKVAFVERLSSVFTCSTSFVLVRCSGVSAARFTQLRFALYKENARILVTKNRLTRVALRDIGKFSAMVQTMSGPMFVAHSDDVASLSKVVCAFVNDKHVAGAKLICGMFGDRLLSAAEVARMATLPPIDEMRGSIVSLIGYAPRELAFSLQQNSMRLVSVLNSYLTEKSKN